MTGVDDVRGAETLLVAVAEAQPPMRRLCS